eukprot:512520_1
MTLYAGFDPITPIIQDINIGLDGQIIVMINSKLPDTFHFELQAENKEDEMSLEEKSTRNASLKINTKNPFGKFSIRVKAINKFGESEWTKWHKYNYKNYELSCTMIPLHGLEATHVRDIIKWWIFEDKIYKDNMKKICTIFQDAKLNGSKITHLSADNVQNMVKQKLLQFMTPESLQIGFKYFKIWKNDQMHEIKSKSAKQIGQMIYNYPLFNLLNEIKSKNVDGTKMIEDSEFIGQSTGWGKQDIYQIKSTLLTRQSFTSKQFTENVNKILAQSAIKTLPNTTIDEIKNMLLSCEAEIIHYHLKKGINCKQLDDFSDVVINLVDELIEMNKIAKENNTEAYVKDDFVKKVYNIMAESFIFNHNLGANDWVCSNCSNHNFVKMIGSQVCRELLICELCGIKQQKSIILRLRNQETVASESQSRHYSSNHNDTKTFENELKNELKNELSNEPEDPMYLNNIKNQLNYFIQVTEVTDEDFVVRLDSINTFPTKRKYDIKEISNQNTLDQVEIRRNEHSVKIVKFPSSLSYPPETSEYRPKAVDKSTIKIVSFENNKEKYFNLYWNLPLQAYGSISYTITYNEIEKIIPVPTLPFRISQSLTPVTIQITTISTFDQKQFVSHPLEIDICSHTKNNINELIQEVLENNPLNLLCPNRNDNQACPSVIKIAKTLIVYKRWLQAIYAKTKGNDDTDQTTQVNIKKYITNHAFNKIFIETATMTKKMTTENVKTLKKLIEEKHMGINVFLKLDRKAFAATIKKLTNIKPALSGRLYLQLMKKIKHAAQSKQYGQYLYDLDIDSIDIHHHHILESHIKNGDKDTVKNIFQFFAMIVHYEDTDTQVKQCRSVNRTQQRRDKVNIRVDNDEKKQNESSDERTNIWGAKQYYIQSQLDIIHSYLCHSKWEIYVKRYAKQYENEQHDEKYDEPNDKLLMQNKAKYVTETTQSDIMNYGFGVEHRYPHLNAIYSSIYDEMLFNKWCRLSERAFVDTLLKSVKKHNIASFKNELKCTHYENEYNIIRNEPIGIRHIFAIIVYTDMTAFCTELRKTYRMTGMETSEDEVRLRHREFYYYSRSLFEAIEFFGYFMDPKLTVYHGLNKMMIFEQFTAYFSQPISTTTSLQVAQRFSEGFGIILSLRRGTKNVENPRQIPKFLPVAWCSDFPGEDEKLFYGEFVQFSIYDIIEAANMQKHSSELHMFNKFQQILNNEIIKWDTRRKETKQLIATLKILIVQKQNSNEVQSKHLIPTSEPLFSENTITKYGVELFNYFCDHQEKVIIQTFTSLPSELYKVLFTENDNKNQI